MNLQAKNIGEYRQAGETLYVLRAAKKYGNEVVSKVALQKLIYLSVVLAPIKDIIINFLRYQYNVRGPFNPDLQNTVDHLVGLGYVRIVDYTYISEKRILISYAITKKGEETVDNLIRFDREQEKCWWITCVCRLAINYSSEDFKSEWKGLDKIVDLVYQDPTFLQGKNDQSFRTGIDLGGSEGLTMQLISFTKDYLEKADIKIDQRNERRVTEIILVLFFEYMYSEVLNKTANDRAGQNY